MIEIEYNEESCTNWYTDVRGATPKEAIMAYINSCNDEDLLYMAKEFATNYGSTYSTSDSCEACGHYPTKYVLTIEVDND